MKKRTADLCIDDTLPEAAMRAEVRELVRRAHQSQVP